jgi:CheY-like chemotaxis protein
VRLLCRSLASQVELRFEVEDTGIGVPEAQRAAIFDRFAQADGASTRRYDGAGLGLAVSRQLCEAMGGAIGVGSGARGGSVFWFTVPMLRAAAPGERSEPAAPIPSPRLRILLVEDNEPNQVVAGAMIERLGHDYRCAPDGPTAVQAAQADDYDLILMDVQMPGMDGMTATRAIRALAGPRGRTPVVAFSAATDSRRQDEYLAAGMNGMLAKPVKLKQLALLFERFAATPASAISAAEPQPESGGRGAAAESEVQALLAAIETAA